MSELHKNMINFFQPLFSHENCRRGKKTTRAGKKQKISTVAVMNGFSSRKTLKNCLQQIGRQQY